MRYEVLGPLRVSNGETGRPVSAPKMGVLLTVLLVRAGRVVPTHELITEIWGDFPPRQAVATIQVYVSQLRKILRSPGPDASPILTRQGGYLLRLGSDEWDVGVAERLIQRGRTHLALADHQAAQAALGAALDLWRGPIAGEPEYGPIIARFAKQMEELRLECLELLIDARLGLGQHRQLVGQLYALTEEFPLRETFSRQLMLALYRSERQADALTVYRVARHTFNAELGLEPSRTLASLHRAILAADADLDLLTTAA